MILDINGLVCSSNDLAAAFSPEKSEKQTQKTPPKAAPSLRRFDKLCLKVT